MSATVTDTIQKANSTAAPGRYMFLGPDPTASGPIASAGTVDASGFFAVGLAEGTYLAVEEAGGQVYEHTIYVPDGYGTYPIEDLYDSGLPAVWMHDTFSGTNATDWNRPDAGPTWTTVGSGFSETGGIGSVTIGTANQTRTARSSTSVGGLDVEVLCRIGCDQLAAGAALAARTTLRQVDANNCYAIGLNIATGAGGQVSMTFASIVASSVTTFKTFAISGLTHTAGNRYWLRAQAKGASPTTLRGKLWLDTGYDADGNPAGEPGFWQWEVFDSTFAAGQVAGEVGVRCSVPTGYTGTLPLTWDFDEFTGQDPSDGSATAYRPFTAGSYWNTPLPVDAPIDPNNTTYLTYLGTANQNDYVRVSGVQATPEWGIPFYWPTTADPVHNVTSYQYAIPPEFATMRIPAGAEPSPNTDSVMVIVDEAAGIIYDLHGVIVSGGGEYSVDSGGVYYTASNGLAHDVTGSNEGRNEGHRGVPNTTGAIRWDEILAGSIPHVIRAASHHNRNTYVFPMDGSDGTVSEVNAPPEGMRLRFKLSTDIDSLSISPFTRIVLRCFQDYGIILGDGSGANYEVKVENTEAEGRGTLFADIGVVNALLSAYDFATYFEVIELGYGS